MPEDYISKRQNVLHKLSAVEINQRFEAVDLAFTRSWLERQDGHPVQALWLRRDALATNELAYLGDSILRLKALDQKWTADVIRKIKSLERNTRLGFTFELLGLAAFVAPGQRVIPAPKGTPGFDGTVQLEKGGSLRLSLKNYGESDFERRVHLRSDLIKKELLAALKQTAHTGFGLRVFASKYPSQSEWASLISELRRVLPSLLRSADGQFFMLSDNWRVQTHSLQGGPDPTLSSQALSFQILVAVPHHENEVKNVISNIDTARANVEKYARKKDECVCHALFLRLRENTSAELCAAWANEYFKDNPSSALDAVFLYQPTIAADPKQNTNSLVHHVTYAGAPRFQKWRQPDTATTRLINLTFFVGVVSNRPSEMMISDGVKLFPIGKHYLHQEGEIYLAYTIDPQGSTTFNLSNPASGITFHAVATLNNESMLLDGSFPPSLDIKLYS